MYCNNDSVNKIDLEGLSSNFLDCLWESIKEYYGLSTLLTRGVVWGLSAPIPKSLLGYPRVAGTSRFTNPLSIIGHELFPELKAGFRFLGTNRIFGMIGRANAILGWGLLAYDIISISLKTYDCMKKASCGT